MTRSSRKVVWLRPERRWHLRRPYEPETGPLDPTTLVAQYLAGPTGPGTIRVEGSSHSFSAAVLVDYDAKVLQGGDEDPGIVREPALPPDGIRIERRPGTAKLLRALKTNLLVEKKYDLISKTIREYLVRGGDPLGPHSGCSMVTWSVWSKDPALVRWLLVAGGSSLKDADLLSSFSQALHWDDQLTAAVLLPRIDRIVTERAEDLLHEACREDHLDALRFFILDGHDVHARNANGETLLHTAIRNRRTEAVNWLLACGADALLTSDVGESAIQVAVANDRYVGKLLTNAPRRGSGAMYGARPGELSAAAVSKVRRRSLSAPKIELFDGSKLLTLSDHGALEEHFAKVANGEPLPRYVRWHGSKGAWVSIDAYRYINTRKRGRIGLALSPFTMACSVGIIYGVWHFTNISLVSNVDLLFRYMDWSLVPLFSVAMPLAEAMGKPSGRVIGGYVSLCMVAFLGGRFLWIPSVGLILTCVVPALLFWIGIGGRIASNERSWLARLTELRSRPMDRSSTDVDAVETGLRSRDGMTRLCALEIGWDTGHGRARQLIQDTVSGADRTFAAEVEAMFQP